MATDIDILYVNKASNDNNPTVLVFMEPTESNLAAHSTAWQVIDNIGFDAWHKFTYTLDTSVIASWDSGSSGTFPVPTTNGKSYALKNTPGGFSLVEHGAISADNEFDVLNRVSTDGGISVTAFKDGKPIATKQEVAKGQKAEFVFHPKLYFGVSSEYELGDAVDSAVMSEEFTPIPLEGLSRLTVTLTGSAETGYRFTTSDLEPEAF